MTGTEQTLTFLSWVRPGIGSLVTAQNGGRAQAGTSITLTQFGADGAAGRTGTRPVSFLLARPAGCGQGSASVSTTRSRSGGGG